MIEMKTIFWEQCSQGVAHFERGVQCPAKAKKKATTNGHEFTRMESQATELSKTDRRPWSWKSDKSLLRIADCGLVCRYG